MKAILVVSDHCEPCLTMKKELEPLIKTGEIEMVDFDTEPAKVQELMEKYGVGLPGLIILGSNGQVIAAS